MYSPDLRERVVAFAKTNGKAQASHLFNVNRRTIYNWMELSLQPKVRAKRTPHKLPEAALAAAHAARPDATLAELAAPFGVSTTAVFKALQRLNLTRKKNVVVHGKVHEKA